MTGKAGTIFGLSAEATARAGAASVINVAIIGASGRVGGRLLELVASRHVAARLASADPGCGDTFVDALLHLPRPLIVIDCSASADIAARYPQWLAAGVDVVTPNKLGPSADRLLARAIAAAQAA